MNQERRIPTIFALLILVFGLSGAITLIEHPLRIGSSADASKEPHSVKVTNISDGSVSVSWVTMSATSGSVTYGEVGDKRVENDDRDQNGNTLLYKTHHITLRNLRPETTYPFTIISGGHTYNDGGKPYHFTTGVRITGQPPAIEPSYGKVLTPTNDPARGALVYLTVAGSSPLSTLVKDSGEWLIPISAARTIDGKKYRDSNNDDQIEITIQGDGDAESSVITDIEHDSPVPDIVLGKNYNFRLTAETHPVASGAVLGTENRGMGTNSLRSIAIIAPAHNSALTTTKPLIRGTALPGKIVRIIVESKPQIGEAQVGTDGLWSWAPEHELSPGTHTITIRTTDETGKAIVKTQRFIVLKSGTQVLGEATPSGTISPTITQFPTLTPTFAPTSTPAPEVTGNPTITIPPKQPTPRSGSSDITLFFLFFGMASFLTGLITFGSWRTGGQFK